MCGGKGDISYSTSFGITLKSSESSGNVLIGQYAGGQTLVCGKTTLMGSTNPSTTTQLQGSYIRVGTASMTDMTLGRNGTKLRGVYQGSKVLTVSATNTAHVVLFTNSQYTSIVGREYKVGDTVLVSNGDYQARPAHVYGTTYRGDNKNWYVCLATGRSGSVRVNYTIVAVA